MSSVGYQDVVAAVSLPRSERVKLPIGRGGRVVDARKYFLSDREVEVLKGELGETKLPNPFNRGTKYYAFEALKALGLNKNHSWTRFTEKFKELASAEKDVKTGKTFWQIFKGREPRNKTTGLNWEGRLEQTLRVLQRLGGFHKYGQVLIDLGVKVLGTNGVVIDFLEGSSGETMIRLNTNSATPLYGIKSTKPVRPVKAKVAKAAKVAKKGKRSKKVKTEVVAEQVTEVAGGNITDNVGIASTPEVVEQPPVIEQPVEVPVDATA